LAPSKGIIMRKAIPLLVIFLVIGLLLAQTGCSKKDDPVTPPPPDCAITMTTPGEIAGQQWFTGELINIRWTKTTGGNVKIDLIKGVDRVAGCRVRITPSRLPTSPMRPAWAGQTPSR
jgi:hypothetical protein